MTSEEWYCPECGFRVWRIASDEKQAKFPHKTPDADYSNRYGFEIIYCPNQRLFRTGETAEHIKDNARKPEGVY